MAVIGRKGATPRKPSLKEMLKEIAVIEHSVKSSIPTMVQAFYVEVVRSYVMESLAIARSKDHLTYGETALRYKTYQASIKDQESSVAMLKANFSEYLTDEKLVEMQDYSKRFILRLATPADEECKTTLRGKEETKSAIEKRLKAVKYRADKFLNDCSNDFSKKVIHVEIVESVLEQFIEGQITLSDFKTWMFKWGAYANRKDMSNKQLCELLGLGDLNSKKLQIEDVVFEKLAVMFGEIYEAARKAA
ncbi:MAG: hypothetical protein JXK16_06290 [Thiotrichales bacterium]|nr:hypothetical protein [Thiotrichales bacterium]